MNTKQLTVETLKITGLTLLLAGLLFVATVWAQTSETEGVAEADAPAEQEAPDLGAGQDVPDLSVTGSPDRARAKEARQRRKALREARRRESVERIRSLRQAAAQNAVVQAAVIRPAEPLAGINIAFKLDPRLTQSLYMGERWVSPPTYSGVQGGDFTVEARVQGRDAKGAPMQISPEWIPADPEMVAVSPSQGNAVQIRVKRAGETSLKVAYQGVTKTLSIKASYPTNSTIQAEISQ